MTMHQPCCQVMHDAKAEKYFSVFFLFWKMGRNTLLWKQKQ